MSRGVPAARERLAAWIDSRRGWFEERLRDFVEVPSVSSDPGHRGDIERMARLAAATLEEAGGRAELRPTRGHPVVRASFGPEAGGPTVVLYNHLDVQPASPDDEPWETDPFRLARRGDRYFGRGTTDDKGPALTALLGVLALEEAGVAPGVRFVWELEEEIGSGHLSEALGGLEGTAVVVVSDTGWLARNRPMSIAALRGFVGFRLSLETAGSDRHSGDVGGAARNPIGELMDLVVAMHDPVSGQVRIPGFYDDVEPLSGDEEEEMLRCGFSLAGFRRDNQLHRLRTEDAREAMRRIWARPTLEVHGVRGGHPGPGLKAVVPGSASVILSCRLVAAQLPDRIAALVEAFVRRRNPDVRVEVMGRALPFRGETDGPLAAALRDAVRFGFGRELVFARDGGSIGAVTTLAATLKCPVMFLGLSLPEHGYHAPNENFDWGQARGGALAFARLLETLATPGGSGAATHPAAAGRETMSAPRAAAPDGAGASGGEGSG